MTLSETRSLQVVAWACVALVNTGCLMIEAPAEGTKWIAGSTEEIVWVSSQVDSVRIELCKDGLPVSEIAATALAPPGVYSWDIPVGLCGNNYSVKLQSEQDVTLMAESGGFSILDVNEVIACLDYEAYPLAGSLTGVVCLPQPEQYEMLAYIEVEDLIWTKPTLNHPSTPVAADGSFEVDIATGGNDRFASRIWLYLVPAGTDAPVCFPCFVEPEISNVVTSRHIDRGPPTRMLDFADFTWSVKRRDFPAGPGDNFFSDRAEDVWVDDDGLHMTVTMREGDWYATEVILKTPLGYGTYIFQTRGRVDVHDPNLVAAGFLWDPGAPPSFRELDFEFARWSLPPSQQPTNAQFVVQPCSVCPGCGDNCQRFTVNLTDQDSNLTHYLIWSEGSVEFRTYLGEHLGSSPPASDLVDKWVHSGEGVPEPGNAAWRFNYWLNDAQPPADGMDAEFLVTDFVYQEEPPIFEGGSVRTNLPMYPLAGSFEGATDVQINGTSVTLGPYGGFREDQVLAEGINIFAVEAFGGSGILATETLEITLDPSFSTEGRPLLYHHGENDETIIVDLEAEAILGVLPGVRIVAATQDGQFAIASDGSVYHTSNHTLRAAVPNLGFGASPVYPVLSFDDSQVYADVEKREFATGTLLSGTIPHIVDNRFATRLPGNILAQSAAAAAVLIDLSTDSVLSTTSVPRQRALDGTSSVDPSGTYAFGTSYSFAQGAIDVVELGSGASVYQADLLSDYMGQVAFTADGTRALVGSYGNSRFGRGGIYVIELGLFQPLSYYEQFGASSIAQGPDGLFYVSSRFVDFFGNGTLLHGSPARRGIDVLQLTAGGELEYVKTYYFNYPHRYETKPMFFITPGS